jgi:hypothetical protein
MAQATASLLIVLKDKVSKGLGKIGSGFNFVKQHALALAAGFAAVTAVVGKVLTAFARQEKADRMLSAALRAHGDNVDALMPKMRNLATEIQRQTTMGDEAALSLMAQIRHLGVMPDQMEQATKGAIGLAKALNLDANSAARYTALALQGEFTVLQRYVPALRTATSEAEKQTIVNDLMAKGYATAMEETDTLAGMTEQMKNVFGDLLETVGSFIAEPAKDLIKWLKEAIIYIKDNRVAIGQFINVIIFMGKVIAQVFDFMIDQVKTAGDIIGDFGSGIVLFMTGRFSAGADAMKSAFTKATTGIGDNYEELITDIGNAYSDMQLKNTDLVKNEQENQKKLTETIKKETDKRTKIGVDYNKLADERRKKLEEMADKLAAKRKKQEEQRKLNFEETVNFIASASESSNKEIAAIGKAAAIGIATRDTYVAATKALASAPPPFNYALAAAVTAAGLSNVAKIAGVPLQEGGVVLPRVGGTLIRAAEAGKPEAVIPLDDEEAKEKIAGAVGTTNIIINAGTIIADETSVKEFAEKIDEELFKLRHNKESIAF